MHGTRFLFCCVTALLLPLAAGAQVGLDPYGLEPGQTPVLQLGLYYDATHANAPPAGCGCFWMSGGGLQLNFAVHPRLSLVADLYGANASRINATNERLSLFNYTFGPRFSLWNHTRYTPYVQGLAGASEVFSNDPVYGQGRQFFAAQAGGGLDVRLGRRLSLVPVEGNWVFSRALNGLNSRQNNTRLGAGIVFRSGRR